VATRKRRSTGRRVARAAAKTRRVYRRAAATKTGQLLFPMLFDGVKDAGAVLAGKASTRIAAKALGMESDSILGIAVGGVATILGGLLINNWDPQLRRSFVGGGFAALAEGPISNLGIPYVSESLGDPYGGWDTTMLPGGYASRAELGDDLMRLGGYLTSDPYAEYSDQGGPVDIYGQPLPDPAWDGSYAGMI